MASRSPCVPGGTHPLVSPLQEAKETQQRQPSCDRHQDNVLDDGVPFLEVFALLLRLRLRLQQQHRGIFPEVYSALVALAAVVLNVLAGGTGVPQRCMTSQAVLDCCRVLLAALRTTHAVIICTSRGWQTAKIACEE